MKILTGQKWTKIQKTTPNKWTIKKIETGTVNHHYELLNSSSFEKKFQESVSLSFTKYVNHMNAFKAFM